MVRSKSAILCRASSNTERSNRFRPGHLPIEDKARYEHGCENVGHKADHKGYGESLHRPGPEEKENGTGHDGRNVSINDGQEGLPEAGVHGSGRGLTRPRLLTNALENEHVTV